MYSKGNLKVVHMVVTFTIVDAETKIPISGIVRLILFNTVYNIPFVNGSLQIDLTGTFKGLTRRFTVISDGYVNHSDLFIQQDSPSFNIELVRFAGVPPPPTTEVPPETPSNLGKLAALGLVGATLIR
jgi:hypothetical protein